MSGRSVSVYTDTNHRRTRRGGADQKHELVARRTRVRIFLDCQLNSVLDLHNIAWCARNFYAAHAFVCAQNASNVK